MLNILIQYISLKEKFIKKHYNFIYLPQNRSIDKRNCIIRYSHKKGPISVVHFFYEYLSKLLIIFCENATSLSITAP